MKCISITALLFLTSCCFNEKPHQKYLPAYKAGDSVSVKGFYSSCRGRVGAFSEEDGSYMVRLDCPGIPEYVRGRYFENEMEITK